MRMRKPTPIKPMGVSVNDTLLKRVVRWLATVAAVAAFAVLGAIVLLEWMAGCGETYIDANGEQHAHECIFLSYYK